MGKIKHISLFNGIGGFQLAAHWAGWENVAHCEIDEWCNKVVAQHFPNSKCYTDIKQFNANEYRNSINVISGGFPCQPFSLAGKQRGKEDDRYLWPEMLRIIREVKPQIVIGENVAGIVDLALDTVLSDLESEGYKTEAFIIPACAINALTDEIECGLLPTPNTGGMDGGSNSRKANKKRLNLMKTPTAFDATVKSGKANPKFGDSGSLAQEIMSGFIANRLLPKPKAQDSRCAKTDRGKSNYGEVLHGIYGRNGQLNPRFVEWTMGYPIGWTELKHSGTP